MFTNELNIQAWVKKIIHGVKMHWLSGKEKIPGAAVRKGGHADSRLGHERIHYY